MEFKGNQSQSNANVKRAPVERPVQNTQWQRPTSKKHVALLIAAAIIIVGGLALWWVKSHRADFAVKGDKYQAIFMTNGQVYFCKLSNLSDTYVTCKDIYYLQVQQAVQPADNKDKDKQPQVSLAKLGSELHGPDDEMHINRDQVLFWENLKDDSKVVKAIKDNQKK